MYNYKNSHTLIFSLSSLQFWQTNQKWFLIGSDHSLIASQPVTLAAYIGKILEIICLLYQVSLPV
jgi:hypothetical protein